MYAATAAVAEAVYLLACLQSLLLTLTPLCFSRPEGRNMDVKCVDVLDHLTATHIRVCDGYTLNF